MLKNEALYTKPAAAHGIIDSLYTSFYMLSDEDFLEAYKAFCRKFQPLYMQGRVWDMRDYFDVRRVDPRAGGDVEHIHASWNFLKTLFSRCSNERINMLFSQPQQVQFAGRATLTLDLKYSLDPLAQQEGLQLFYASPFSFDHAYYLKRMFPMSSLFI